ncbi:MAG TPA: glycosyltransferase [Gemmatimonadaceae bacterium]|jgi:glycosyltransferase involved in cell wall biosynthesis
MFGLRGLRPDLEIGGFETAFSEIAPRLVDRGHRVTIYCRAEAHSPERRVPRESGVDLVYMPAPGGKNFSGVTSTGLAVLHALAARRFDVWFFVNVGMGHHAALARLAGRPVVMSVDGLDWQRGKWGPVARAYFRSAARAAVRSCTTLITDAEAMRAYYQEHFARDSAMIAYGASIERSAGPEAVSRLGLARNEYYLIVSRLIPENSLDSMLEGYRRSATTKSLVVVGAANYRDAFHARLSQIAASDPRIRMLGHVSDQSLLNGLWCNCYCYLHGHSVGGTNPALLRALGCGSAVLARDTVFNREVLGDIGEYFEDDAESVRATIESVDARPVAVAAMRTRGPARIRERYSWESVVGGYERVFREAVERCHSEQREESSVPI